MLGGMAVPRPDWAKLIRPGARVFIGSNAACPHALINELLRHPHLLQDVEFCHILTLGPTPWLDELKRQGGRVNAFFLGPGVREGVNAGDHDYTPSHLSEVPGLFRDGLLPLDLALVEVSPPDATGYCSFGVSVDIVSAACRHARQVVAQINPLMPRTLGDPGFPLAAFAAAIEQAEPLPTLPEANGDPVLQAIGGYVAQLVEDHSTLQCGIGRLANAVLAALGGHRHLGLHTEMLSDGAMHLMQKGVIDNSRKTLHPGQSVATFCLGSDALYRFVDNNRSVRFFPSEYANNPAIIARNHRMVAINSALEVDVTGQVAADALGRQLYSGIGGQVDFIRGAAQCPEGLPIIALPSTAEDGATSRIVASFAPGTSVVTTRADVHFVVTEYGIATLRGRSIRERVLAMIQIAHPRFRESLLREARDHKLIPPDIVLVPETLDAWNGIESLRLPIKGRSFILRPLHPSDEKTLQTFFYSHTRETVRQRYGYMLSRMSRERAGALVGVDQTRDLALGVFEVKGSRQTLHAIGRYYLDHDQPKQAEFAVIVKEESRRLGLGRVVLQHLVTLGQRRGLTLLWATTAKKNQPMLNLTRKLGGRCRAGPVPEETLLEIPLV